MEGTPRSELAAELEGCARLCEESARLDLERRDGVAPALLLAAAALDTAARALDATALMIASTLVGDALAAVERRGLDEPLLHCVAALRGVAALCERELDR
jgi:hypothetical protein